MLDQFGGEMAVARAAGVDFDQAWSDAIAGVCGGWDAQALRHALIGTRGAWQRAYLGDPPTRAELAVARVFACEPEHAERIPLAA